MQRSEERARDYSERFCPRYQRAVEIVGRRWSGAILQVMLAGATRFGEILDAVPDLSNRMLSERLREFEEEGIAERVVIPERPVRVEYRLTEKGRALHDVVDALSRWSARWIEVPEPEA
ncbi:putative transcriptional regulators [Rubrobacter radiotolerans]|uniref:Helix-turn-helix domain-containing protein n=1 Tax=Rubrobacter radiotolerans TaxID=42256 RepID=A0A023X1D6_RUBRA|nr:helix-turn-helix domain-containing protein [Rubrobacter radiotolerans]AHY45879.1 putative transcriptional regulators [Rubrobacter radiotolerans]MDX5893292.1 helix-turn-helix domain-containing protein [Rubrobacter radiotolerans]SMC03440.1 transcriptional regulator, HxlR family [Rubrobacter radiotolerans DSM 5868]